MGGEKGSGENIVGAVAGESIGEGGAAGAVWGEGWREGPWAVDVGGVGLVGMEGREDEDEEGDEAVYGEEGGGERPESRQEAAASWCLGVFG